MKQNKTTQMTQLHKSQHTEQRKSKHVMRRMVAFLLCMLFALMPFLAIDYSSFSAFAAELPADEKMTVSLGWKEGTEMRGTYMDGYDGRVNAQSAAGSNSARIAVLTATGGTAGVETTVYLSTFDISACEAAGEYVGFKRKAITIKSGESKEITIDDGKQSLQKKYDYTNKKYMVDANGNYVDDKATQISGYRYNSYDESTGNGTGGDYYYTEYYTRQFGIKIVEIDEDVAKLGNHIIRAQIRAAGVINTKQNNSYSGTYDFDSHSSSYDEKMFSHVGAFSVYTDNRYTYYRSDDGSYGSQSNAPVKVVHNSSATLYFDGARLLTSTTDPKAVLDYYGADKFDYYYTGEFLLQQYAGIAQQGFEIKVTNGGTTIFKNGLKKPNQKFGHYIEFFNDITIGGEHYKYSESDGKVDKSVSNLRGTMEGNWAKMDKDKDTVSLYIYNFADLYDKKISQARLYTCLVHTERPTIVGYSIANDITYGYNQAIDAAGNRKTDEMYVSVRFSMPVQVRDIAGTFCLNGTIGGEEIVFKYVDGSFTDTLIFKADLPVGQYYGSSVTLTGFSNTDASQVKVANLLVDTKASNNAAVLDKNQLGTISGLTIDSRIPALTAKNLPTEGTANSTQRVGMQILNVGTGGKVEYAWTMSEDIDSVENWISYTMIKDADDGLYYFTGGGTGSGFNDLRYLHIRATSATGVRATYSSPAILFDNTAPRFSTPMDTDYGMYLKNHTLKLVVTDTYSAIDKIYLYVKKDTTTVIERRLVYDKRNGGGAMTANGSSYSMTLTHADVGLAENSYGAYTVGYVVVDALGNTSTLGSGAWCTTPLQFDNRATYEVLIKNADGTATLEPDLKFAGNNVYYNQAFTVKEGTENKQYPEVTFGDYLKMTIESGEAGSTGDVYKLYSIARDGYYIYNNDAWADGKTAADWGFAEAIDVQNTGGKMVSKLSFNDNANGLYEIVFIKNGEQQSEVIPLYLTSYQKSTKNYEALYADDRLLINRVWRFASNRYYSYDNPDVYTSYGSAPIFSTRDKAIEYAKFMEMQDIEILYLGEDSESQSRITSLNTGFGDYKKALNETMAAGVRQTWVRYKSAEWVPDKGSSVERTNWVYYYYSAGDPVTKLNADRLSDLLKAAILDNAKDIANAKDALSNEDNYTSGLYYLTGDGGDNSGKLNTYGEPTYSQSSIFYAEQTIAESDCNFAGGLKWTGDRGIYDSKITYVKTENDKYVVPLVANYTFSLSGGRFTALACRLVGTDTWTSILDGAFMRDVISTTGLYEVAEIGGGYNHYYIYCDFTAPGVVFSYEKSETNKGQAVFDSTFHNGSYKGLSLTLNSIIDLEHQMGNYTEEYDKYAFLYLTQNLLSQRLMKDEINAKNYEAEPLENGNYVLTIRDRLGNVTSLTVRVSSSEMIIQEPTENKNKSISFFVNRKKSEIERFEIYRDDKLIDNTFEPVKTYVQSGVYRMFVTDIYGNSYDSGEIKFQRELPKVRFLYKNAVGTWTGMTPYTGEPPSKQSPAVVEVNADGTYYTVSTSAAIRIAYDISNEYIYAMEEPEVELTSRVTLDETMLEIPVSDTQWHLTLRYEDDPGTFITITCVRDTTNPHVTASVEIPNFTDNEALGANNVLVSSSTTSTTEVGNGGKSNANSITFTWEDETRVASVTYTKDGGEPQTATVYPDQDEGNTKTGSITLQDEGHYVLTVKDILGNTTVFEYTLNHSLDFSVYNGKDAIKYHDNPLEHIFGTGESAVYDTTVYTGRDISVAMRESMNVALMWTDGTDSGIYYFNYEYSRVEQGKDVPLTETAMLHFNIFQVEDESAMSVSTDVVANPTGNVIDIPGVLVLQYTFENGVLTLHADAPDKGYELWQFRFYDVEFTHPFIVQLERSNKKPSVLMTKEDDGSVIMPFEDEYVGANDNILFGGNISDVVQAVAYRSDIYTTDFTNIPAENIKELLLSDGTLDGLYSAGYYMVVLSNKYGNKQVLYVRISFGMSVDVEVAYHDEGVPRRSFTITAGGKQNIYTNERVEAMIWDKNSTYAVTKDGMTYEPAQTMVNSVLKLIFNAVGRYVLEVVDECGNTYTLYIFITDPTTVIYEDYLTGFNKDAVKKNDKYTNAPLSVSKDMLDTGGIQYVAYRKRGTDNWVAIYDMLSANHVEYTPEGFTNCIGTEDGIYDVLFTDAYGNPCKETVHISRKEQLTVSRQTKMSKEEFYYMSEVLARGPWSNYLVRLKNTAAEYYFTVDGVPTTFDARGIYQCVLPGSADGAEDHEVVYIDEYGNKYVFTMHMFRKTPLPRTEDSKIINVNGASFTRSDLGYTWDGNDIVAFVSVDNADEVVYEKGQLINKDGAYVIRFVDIAGNVATRRITRDTRIDYELKVPGGTGHNGVTASGNIRIRELDDEVFTILSVTRNGKAYENTLSGDPLSFSEQGNYVVKLRDAIGNEGEVRFSLYNTPTQSFTYYPDGEYQIVQVWYNQSGNFIPYTDNLSFDENNKQCFYFVRDGEYQVEMVWGDTEEYAVFTVEIDNVAPTLKLVGVENGGSTRLDISFENVGRNDTVEIWRDGELLKADGTTVLSDAGEYKVVVRDLAGNETVYKFTREFTTNTAANLLICFVLVGVALGVAIYIRSRGKIRNK